MNDATPIRDLLPSALAQRRRDVSGQTYLPGVAPDPPDNGPAGAAGAAAHERIVTMLRAYAPVATAKLAELSPSQLASLAHAIFERSGIDSAQLTRLGAALRSESLCRWLSTMPVDAEGTAVLDIRRGTWSQSKPD